MKPNKEHLQRLREQIPCGAESYHWEFDQILEERLMELDPEWMQTMQDEYVKSGMARWYA